VIVCSCNVLSDTSIRASIQSDSAARTLGAVYRCLGCRPNCGRCFATVQKLISETNHVEANGQADCTATCAVMTTLP
jgi:bacterioferritin-associated ferredoxin